MIRPVADDGAALAVWLARASITEIRVVSPHLDDAAFSLAEFLARPGFPSRRVLTVFTKAGPMTLSDHALAMGFADADAEFRARRDEDTAAMRRLGTDFVHCGLESGKMDPESAVAMVHCVLDGLVPGRTLVLLPLGAGRVLSGLARFGRRILRMPTGCGVHGDHLWVRDHIRGAIGPAIARVGYYAEIPYQWANTGSDLAAQARKLASGPVVSFSLPPDVNAKLTVLHDYASQFESEFGGRRPYQRRTASIPEKLFLTVQDAMTA